MGLTRAEQLDVEGRYWLPIERHTGETIGAFWRHYHLMTTDRQVSACVEQSKNSAFQHSLPLMDHEPRKAKADIWPHHAEIYGLLLDPSTEEDAEIRRQLEYINTFGRAAYPLAMSAYSDHARGLNPRRELIETLEWIQALYLRRALVGLPAERLI